MLAALFVLLRRYSRQEDIIVGELACASRQSESLSANNLSPLAPLRLQPLDDQSFEVFLDEGFELKNRHDRGRFRTSENPGTENLEGCDRPKAGAEAAASG